MQAIHLLAGLALAGASVVSSPAAEVRMFAAASLADALQAIVPGFTASSGHAVQLNLGASGLLARQVREGAPADVFFSADELQIERLEQEGWLVPGTRRLVLANTLVLIVPVSRKADVVRTWADLATPAVRRVAIGQPETVPAGNYAREYLETLQLWREVAAKAVPLDNVRAVLAAVAAGNVDAGIVYVTDAKMEKQVQVIAALPWKDGPRIVYSAAVIRTARAPEAARALLDHLGGEAAQAIFRQHGFAALPVAPEVRR